MIHAARFVSTFVLPSILFASVVHADVTKAQCVDANINAQTARRAGRFAEARSMLAICGDPQCPAAVRDDCTRRMDDLEQAQPTIVLEVQDPTGADVPAVRVTIHGVLVAEKLDGKPIPIDPGSHLVTVEAHGQPPVTQPFLLTEGEKGRRAHFTIGSSQPDAPVVRKSISGQRLIGVVGAGLGAAGLAVGSIFGAMAMSKASAARADCASAVDCPDYTRAVNDRSAASSNGTASTVAFVAGGALLAAGAVVFLTAPSSHAPVELTPAAGPGSASLLLQGWF
jgi:hypothetical protein